MTLPACSLLCFVNMGNVFFSHHRDIRCNLALRDQSLLSRPLNIQHAGYSSQMSRYVRGKSVSMALAPPLFEPQKTISSVAELGLKLKLRQQTQVKVSVFGGMSELLQGQILGVNVTGRDWMSPGMLTCRTIQCSVGGARIDLSRLARGAIELTQPVRGACAVDLTAADFANFLCHPKVAAAAAAAPPPLAGAFRFARQCRIDPAAVLFAGTWRGAPVRMALAQGPARRAAVRPLPTAGAPAAAAAEELAAALGAFFNTLVLDLDGARLMFDGMDFSAAAAGGGGGGDGAGRAGEATVRLRLRIEVVRFPNPITTTF